MIRDADISPNGVYRYSLTRTWGSPLDYVVFCQLNPSSADAFKEDPTLNRNIGFARAWGYGGCLIVNLYAYRTADPKVLIANQKCGVDVVGPKNAAALAYAFTPGRLVIACWGAAKFAQVRAKEVMTNFPQVDFHCLRLTKSGAPEHVLYLPSGLKPVLYRAAAPRMTA